MGRPPKALARDTRQTLMDAALELFAARGFYGVGLRDIARQAGVRESALYHYFDSKEALLSAILEAHSAHFVVVSGLIDGPYEDVRAWLTAIVRAILEEFADPAEQFIFRLLMHDGLRLSTDGRVDFAERIGARMAAGERLIHRLIDDGFVLPAPVDHLAAAFFGPLMLWRQLLACMPGHPLVLAPEPFLAHHVDQFLRGAGPIPARRVP